MAEVVISATVDEPWAVLMAAATMKGRKIPKRAGPASLPGSQLSQWPSTRPPGATGGGNHQDHCGLRYAFSDPISVYFGVDFGS